MIKINLLSPWDKENLKWEKINNLVAQNIVAILFVETAFVAVFFFSAEYLKVEQSSVSSQIASIEDQVGIKEVKKMEADLAGYKEELNTISNIQKEHLNWTLLFENISNLVPEGVRLQSVSSQAEAVNDDKNKTKNINSNRFRIELAGKAKTRDDLLALEKNLKSSEMFSDLEYNDSNYVNAVDVDFKYIFYINKDKLLK